MKPPSWLAKHDSEASLAGKLTCEAFNLLAVLLCRPASRINCLSYCFQSKLVGGTLCNVPEILASDWYGDLSRQKKSNTLVYHVSDLGIATLHMLSWWSRCKPPCIKCLHAGIVLAILLSIIAMWDSSDTDPKHSLPQPSCALSCVSVNSFSFLLNLPHANSPSLNLTRATLTTSWQLSSRPDHQGNFMERTIRQRRFMSLSTRRQQKDEEGNTIYESMNKAPTRHETSGRLEGALPNADITASSPSSSPEINASTSVETLSDMSVTTPNGIPVTISDMKQHNEASDGFFEAPALKLIMPSMPKEKAASSPKLVLAPSLSKPSDFSFDRYSKVIKSAVVEPPEPDDIEVFEVSEAACSPIEVATPITYIRPNRPSMVSIFNILDRDSSRETKKPLPAKPDVPSRNTERPVANKRLSTISNHSGFMAGEATPFQLPDLPDNALTMISNASQTDLSIPSRHQEPALKKQKSSMALLSKAFKYGHSRMSSRAHSISPSAEQSRPRSQHNVSASMPGPAPTAKLPPTPSKLPPTLSGRPQLPQPHNINSKSISSRPQTAAPSTGPPPIPVGVTALPPCSESFSERSSPIVGKPSPLMGHTSRKKSISALRSRSDSIGNTLMSITGKSSVGRSKGRNVAREALASPSLLPESQRPILVTSTKPSIDLNTFPTPPLPSRPQSNHGSVVSFSRPLRNNSMPLQGLGVTVN